MGPGCRGARFWPLHSQEPGFSLRNVPAGNGRVFCLRLCPDSSDSADDQALCAPPATATSTATACRRSSASRWRCARVQSIWVALRKEAGSRGPGWAGCFASGTCPLTPVSLWIPSSDTWPLRRLCRAPGQSGGRSGTELRGCTRVSRAMPGLAAPTPGRRPGGLCAEVSWAVQSGPSPRQLLQGRRLPAPGGGAHSGEGSWAQPSF